MHYMVEYGLDNWFHRHFDVILNMNAYSIGRIDNRIWHFMCKWPHWPHWGGGAKLGQLLWMLNWRYPQLTAATTKEIRWRECNLCNTLLEAKSILVMCILPFPFQLHSIIVHLYIKWFEHLSWHFSICFCFLFLVYVYIIIIIIIALSMLSDCRL